MTSATLTWGAWAMPIAALALSSLTLADSTLPSGTVIDSLVVRKAQRQLQAYSGKVLIKTYPIQLGRNPVGDKRFEGDDRTPEGPYTINEKNPRSQYYKNLGISYPNAQDRAEARRLGKPAGGLIKVHGFPAGVDTQAGLPNWGDWTFGCIAVTNQDIDELYEAVPIGTPILILP